jgi:hypothetical protein
MPKNRNFDHSVWLLLYSKPLDLRCMKWFKSTLCSDCYTKIYSFIVLNYGPKDWSSLQYWGCQNTVCEVCMQKSLFWDRLHSINSLSPATMFAVSIIAHVTKRSTHQSWLEVQCTTVRHMWSNCGITFSHWLT